MRLVDPAAADAHERQWLGVSSPAAREVVEAVFRSLPGSALEHHSYPLSGGDAYRQEIRRRLERSQLAQKLAAGADMLPLIDDYLPRWLRPLRDRTYTQSPGTLAVHVMDNLEWYLGPPRPAMVVQLGVAWRRHRVSFSFLLAAIVLAVIGFGVDDGRRVFMVATASLLIGFLTWGLEYVGHSQGYSVHCAEFFRYLVDTYSDAPASAEPD
jgi:hypothetical protein